MLRPTGKQAWTAIQVLTTLAVIIAYAVIGAVLGIDVDSTMIIP